MYYKKLMNMKLIFKIVILVLCVSFFFVNKWCRAEIREGKYTITIDKTEKGNFCIVWGKVIRINKGTLNWNRLMKDEDKKEDGKKSKEKKKKVELVEILMETSDNQLALWVSGKGMLTGSRGGGWTGFEEGDKIHINGWYLGIIKGYILPDKKEIYKDKEIVCVKWGRIVVDEKAK